MSKITNPPTIPVHLLSLFEMMDFLGSARKDGKPCFHSKRYVDRNSYIGAVIRWINGEKQSTYGNAIIRNCCEETSQAYSSYVGTDFEHIILDKMINLYRGLEQIALTYEKDEHEIDTVNHIRNSLMIINMKIPHNIKVQNGLVPPSSNVLVPSSSPKLYSLPAPVTLSQQQTATQSIQQIDQVPIYNLPSSLLSE
jgi:hypothetical protein